MWHSAEGPTGTGCVTLRRGVVERTFGWLMHHHRRARDNETHPTAPKP